MVVRLESGCFYGRTRAELRTEHLFVVSKRCARGETTPRHGHARPYLALVVHGAFRQYDERTEHLCTPGSLAINTAGAEHRDRFEARVSEVLNIELDPDWLAALHDEGARDPGYAWSAVQDGPARARTMRAWLERPDIHAALALEGLAAELLALALRFRTQERGPAPAWLRAVEDALSASFRRPPPLAELASIAERSPSQVVRAFRRYRGTTPGGFARRLRAEHARRALTVTSAPLHEIALEAGYADQSHMTRELAALVGCTPGRLRRELGASRAR